MTKAERAQMADLKQLTKTMSEIIESLHSVVGLLTREMRIAKATIDDLRRYNQELGAIVKKYEKLK